MHELFAQVLTKKDLSKAGELFSLDDSDIKNDLTQVLERICEIAKSPEYATSDNDQSVVEICITRVTSAIRETHSIEENAAGLVQLLEVCHTHNLRPSGIKDADPPHTKIASDIMSCLFMHYGKEKVMSLAIPVVVKFLSTDHKELSHNVSSYLSLAAIDNADMLAQYMDLIVNSILKGKHALARVLPQIYTQNPEPVTRRLPELVAVFEPCGVSERVSLLQVFGMIAKSKPKILELHVAAFCKYLSVSTLIPLILAMFVDMATANPAAFIDHMTVLKQMVDQQAAFLHQVVQIVGAVGTVSQPHAIRSMAYLVLLLAKVTDQSALVVILQEIKALGLLHHELLEDNISEISRLSQSGSSSVRILVHQLKEDHKKYSGQREMRSVSSQTEGTVTIITVGSPAYPSNVVGVRQQQPNSARSSQQSLSKSSRNSISNNWSLTDRPVSPASTLDRASLNSALTLNSSSGLPPEPLRDGVKLFCEKHMDTIRKFINSLSARIPLPAKCSIVDGRHKRYVRLNFHCGIHGSHCLYGKQFFVLNTKLPKTWIHLMFLAVQAQSQSALSQQDLSVSSLKACWDALYPEKGNRGYLTLVTSSFPSARDQDALLQELHSVRYFDVFEFNAPKKYWACFMCNHPEKLSQLMPDGSPVIAGQLKEKKGRWKFLKRWKTRYFTLSGSQITYSKSDSSKETLPVREIQSVKAVRKGIRDIPKAFEIFTTDQNYVFKAKGQQDIEPWVQCIHLAVAKAQTEAEQNIVENAVIPRPRPTVRDTKL
ncbi:ventricular zone-expressed PH domain-containing protein homolog 1-like [Dreissena polymorpha]|uniref:ventricular zone-expressed PH domain-containing protein homolog 1-like n=1 Tax=Dreissena polymorpha TaxID=45954 RepID=UPI0022655A2C|nr:ventricular zone-expressed PH domain-containing protein homolog 1-like [Dreissena polymorpha]